jgi:adenine phosphoribosyltransferase
MRTPVAALNTDDRRSLRPTFNPHRSNKGPCSMNRAGLLDLKDFIRDIPDHPKPGILFRDITPLLRNPDAFQQAIEMMADQYRDAAIDVVVAAEARGFIFAAPIAIALGVGFVPVRKPGKLPYQRHSYRYELEYGSDTLEMHVDGVERGQRVLIVDDLLATGGTVEACCRIVEQSDATIVGCAFLVELIFLNGKQRLRPHPVFSLIQYH